MVRATRYEEDLQIIEKNVIFGTVMIYKQQMKWVKTSMVR
jgi:hypothetical protein